MKKHKGKGAHTDFSSAAHSSSRQPALVIFAKAPVPGHVKTRLCPPLTPDEAASLHGSLVLDMLERTGKRGEYIRLLACAPSKDHPFFKTVGGRFGITLLNQLGDDLGSRMAKAFDFAFDQGHHQVMLIGTDIPYLTISTIQQAIHLLSHHDLVLGPTFDGGYYLIGMKRSYPELFLSIPWSSSDVLSFTQRNAQHLGLSVGLLNMERDLDTFEDLHTFIMELAGPRKQHFSKRTAGVLQSLAQRHMIPTK